MGTDQYLAFSILSRTFDQFHTNPLNKYLFFVIESIDVGKSYLFSVVELTVSFKTLVPFTDFLEFLRNHFSNIKKPPS